MWTLETSYIDEDFESRTGSEAISVSEVSSLTASLITPDNSVCLTAEDLGPQAVQSDEGGLLHARLIEIGSPVAGSDKTDDLDDKAQAQAIVEGPEARSRLIEMSIGLVTSIAMRYQGRGVPLEDLVQGGMLGAIDAVDKFDQELGVTFTTHAYKRIKRHIKDTLANQAGVISVPARTLGNWHLIEKERKQLSDDLGREPTKQELESQTDLSITHTYAALKAAVQVPTSLDTPISENSNRQLGDVIPDSDVPGPEAVVIGGLMKHRLDSSLNDLPEQEVYVLSRYFGWHDGESWTLDKISKELGVVPSYVHHLKTLGLKKLRFALRGQKFADYSELNFLT